MGILAIIPAAGVGTRMGRETPKQFLLLEGTPIFLHTLRKFDAAQRFDEIFLAVRQEEARRVRAVMKLEDFSTPVRLTTGAARDRILFFAPSPRLRLPP